MRASTGAAVDTILFDNPTIQVTTSAIHVRRGGTYFLAQVSSVHVLREEAWGLVALGAFLVFFGFAALAMAGLGALGSVAMFSTVTDGAVGGFTSAAILALAGGIPAALSFLCAWWVFSNAKPTYWLALVTSAGQVRAVNSKDAAQMEQLRQAILSAMASRR